MKRSLLIALVVLVGYVFTVAGYAPLATRAYAQTTNSICSNQDGATEDCQNNANKVKANCNQPKLNEDNCAIYRYILLFTNALSALVAVVVVIAIVLAGIQYSASQNNPQATANAKKHIFSALLALVLYMFMFAFLQWIVPGGIF